MSNQEEVPDVEEIKERLKVDIPVEEEPTTEEPASETSGDVAAELRNLGRQFAETLRAAWTSQERHKVESEIREGVKFFADEVDKVVREVRESAAAQKAKEEATALRGRIESGEITDKARVGLAQGLQRLSEELARLADKFTPAEKGPVEEKES